MLTTPVDMSLAVTTGAPLVVEIAAPGAVAAAGSVTVVCKGIFVGTVEVSVGTELGVSGACVASVIVAVSTEPVPWAAVYEPRNRAMATARSPSILARTYRVSLWSDNQYRNVLKDSPC